MFLKLSQNSHKNTCTRVDFLINLLKNRLWHRCFPLNFAKFLRTSFLQNTSGWLLLKLQTGNFKKKRLAHKFSSWIFVKHYLAECFLQNLFISLLLFSQFWKYGGFGQQLSRVDTEVVAHRCSVRKMFLEFPKICRKAPVSESPF